MTGIGIIFLMSVEITGKYKGNLRVELTHGPSGTVIETDAPVDNNGKGEKFSPTDLLSSSLGACMLTIMGIVADRDNIDLKDANFKVEKHMATDTPRRVKKIVVEINLPNTLSDEEKKKLERAAHTCPVHHSLLPEIEKEVNFNYVI